MNAISFLESQLIVRSSGLVNLPQERFSAPVAIMTLGALSTRYSPSSRTRCSAAARGDASDEPPRRHAGAHLGHEMRRARGPASYPPGPIVWSLRRPHNPPEEIQTVREAVLGATVSRKI